MGDKPIEIDNWKHFQLNFGLILTAHPDLNVIQSINPESTLTLLGFMLDADHPEATDTEILSRIHSDNDNIDALVQKTELLSGRWILIYASQASSFIFNDVTGFRDVYYTQVSGVSWCGSQPHMMAKYLNIAPVDNPDMISFFTRENIIALNTNWTTDYSPFEGIRHLLPNHYLDLRQSVVRRFMLNFTPSVLPMHQALRENCRIISNIMLAARNRYKLMVACTAGCDSRVLLSACKKISDSVYFYIYRFNNMAANHPDIAVPAKMFKDVSIPFHIIENTETEDAAFSDAVDKSTMFPRFITNPLYYHYYQKFADYMNVSEHTMPAFKVYFDRLGKTDALHLADAYHQPHTPFVLKWLQSWIDSTESAFPKDRFDISDLYFWEVFLGNQNGTTAAEQDISIEDISPSNCRRFYLNFFSVAKEYHTEAHTYDFHHKMIELMWKELLDYPFNPGLKNYAIDFLKKHNLFFKAKHIKATLKSIRNMQYGSISG